MVFLISGIGALVWYGQRLMLSFDESLNQTLNRTIITSLTTMIVVCILYMYGGEVLKPFSFALIVGIIIGTYSSLFVASPIMLFLENKFNVETEEQ